MALFFLAIAAGFLTVLAPCILPILPVLLGAGGKSGRRPLFIVAGFVGGFGFIGAAFATFGNFFWLGGEGLRAAAVIFLFLFGWALLLPSLYERLASGIQPLFARTGAIFSRRSVLRDDAFSGILVGLSLGLVWTPCAGPILGTILTLAARTKDFLSVMLLMTAYALGAGLPMLAIAYGGREAAARLRSFGVWQPVFSRLMGLAIVITAIAMWTGYDVYLVSLVAGWYPLQDILKL